MLRSILRRSATLALLAGLTASTTGAETAPAAPPSVLDGVETVPKPVQSFLPKYQPELFVGVGYSGTFTSAAHQWPTLVVSPLEGLLARPGNFDIGAYSELRLGRPDENLGRFEVGVGVEVMWRFVETPITDWAAVLRGAYLIDTSNPGTPLVRPGLGVQVSLVRSLALQLTYDELFSPSEDFSNGQRLAHGLSTTLKIGLCPMFEFCPQLAERPAEKLDRSAVTCHEAGLTCQTARSTPTAGSAAALCGAAQLALDTSRYPADWDDPVGAFLRALRASSSPALLAVVGASLSSLESAHAASIQGSKEYAEKLRSLDGSHMLSKSYGYLVTPVMVRDWLGCDAEGHAVTCATDALCEHDTGVAP